MEVMTGKYPVYYEFRYHRSCYKNNHHHLLHYYSHHNRYDHSRSWAYIYIYITHALSNSHRSTINNHPQQIYRTLMHLQISFFYSKFKVIEEAGYIITQTRTHTPTLHTHTQWTRCFGLAIKCRRLDISTELERTLGVGTFCFNSISSWVEGDSDTFIVSIPVRNMNN